MDVCQTMEVSERRACTILGQARKTQRRISLTTDDETRLVARITELATQYGRYGYRRTAIGYRTCGIDSQ